jgi:hypothetical protein
MPAWPGFIGGAAPSQSVQANCEDLVNMYVERLPQNLKSPGVLVSTPGFQRWTAASAVADVGGRGSLNAAGRFLAVIGGGFYEFDVNGTPTKRGTVTLDANPAQLVFNGVVGGQVLISAGANAYCFTLATNAFAQVLSGTATQIAYSQGYFLAFDKNTGRTALSALNDGTSWPGATFFQRSLLADPMQAMFVDGNGLVWSVGTESFDVRYNSGVGTVPFVPLSGMVGQYGIASSFAFALVGSIPYWLSQTKEGAGLMVQATGSGVQVISPYAVANAVSTYARTSRIDDAELLGYQDQGHTFLNISFPSAGATWSLDVESKIWARRGRWNAVAGRYDVWSPRAHANVFGKHLITDRATGQVSLMDPTLATEIDGTGIRRVRVAPALFKDDARLPLDQLLLLVDGGVGLPFGQGSNPLVMLRQSQNGGKTYGNQRIAGLGRQGEWGRRVYWNRLGTSANRAIEVSCSEPVPFRIVNALVNPTEDDLARAA